MEDNRVGKQYLYQHNISVVRIEKQAEIDEGSAVISLLETSSARHDALSKGLDWTRTRPVLDRVRPAPNDPGLLMVMRRISGSLEMLGYT